MSTPDDLQHHVQQVGERTSPSQSSHGLAGEVSCIVHVKGERHPSMDVHVRCRPKAYVPPNFPQLYIAQPPPRRALIGADETSGPCCISIYGKFTEHKYGLVCEDSHVVFPSKTEIMLLPGPDMILVYGSKVRHYPS